MCVSKRSQTVLTAEALTENEDEFQNIQIKLKVRYQISTVSIIVEIVNDCLVHRVTISIDCRRWMRNSQRNAPICTIASARFVNDRNDLINGPKNSR